MHVFITGATGWIGSAVAAELLGHGHEVTGLARSDASASLLEARGVRPHRGDLDDLDSVRAGAEEADAVIHLAFKHDFTDLQASARTERNAVVLAISAHAGSRRAAGSSCCRKAGGLGAGMTQQVRDADRVLVIASPEYKRRAEGGAGPDEGRGVQWEARLIRESFYADQEAGLQRFITVVLPGCSAADIPLWLAPMSTAHYLVSEYTAPGAETLLRALTGQPAELEPPLGSVPVLAPRGTAEPPVTPTRVEAGPVVRSAYLEQVRQIAPPQLRDRNSELAELAAFCTEQDRDSYVWWRAPAWAGKSALMSWFVLHPPPAVQIASFFITARYQGQDDRAAFTDAVMRPPVRQSKVVTSLASLDGRRLATGVIAVPSRIRLIVNAAAVSRIHGSAISQRRFFSPTA